jgi:Tfp pilus assembly protein PilZ
MTDDDKRWRSGGMRSPRIDCNGSTDFSVDGRLYNGMVKNMSESGVLIESFDAFALGKEVILSFMCPKEKKPIKRKGVIVRITEKGFGVEYKY